MLRGCGFADMQALDELQRRRPPTSSYETRITTVLADSLLLEFFLGRTSTLSSEAARVQTSIELSSISQPA